MFIKILKLPAAWQLSNTDTAFKLPKKNTSNGQKTFSFRGAKLWNNLDSEAKKATSLRKLCSKIFLFFLFCFLLKSELFTKQACR